MIILNATLHKNRQDISEHIVFNNANNNNNIKTLLLNVE